MAEKRMAVVAIALAAGILMADRIPLAACALLVASAVLIALLITPTHRRVTLLVIASVVMCGAMRYASDRSIAFDDVSYLCPKVSAIEGTVASGIGGAAESKRLRFCVKRAKSSDGWHKASGHVMVTMYLPDNQKSPNLEYGDRLRLDVHPYIPYEPTNPGQFSWKGYLARHGIYCCASVRHGSDVTVLSKNKSHSIVRAALAVKNYLVSSIYRIHSKEIASVMSGIVLGTYSYIDDDTLMSFTRTGTMHVLAASGYNCFVLLIIATPVLSLLRIFPRYRGIVLVWLIAMYLLMVGPVPSMLRAAVMAALVLLAATFKRIPDYKNLFYVAAFVVLLFDPSNLFDIGFQLSFLAVWGLIVVAPVIDALLERTPLKGARQFLRSKPYKHLMPRAIRFASSWFTRALASVGVATIAVSLTTGPIVAFYFNYVSIASLPANFAVECAVPIVFFDSCISPITSQIPHCGHWIGELGTISTRVMLSSVDYLGSMRYSAVSVQSPAVLAIIGYYVALYAVGEYVRSKYAA